MHITSHKSFYQKSNNFFHSAFHCLINGNLRLGCWRTMGSRGWGDKVHICLGTLCFRCGCVAGHSPQLSCSQYKVLITVGGTRVRMLLSDLSKYWPRCNSLTIYPIFSQVLAHSAKYSITLLMLICWFSTQWYVIYIILHDMPSKSSFCTNYIYAAPVPACTWCCTKPQTLRRAQLAAAPPRGLFIFSIVQLEYLEILFKSLKLCTAAGSSSSSV